MAQVLVAGVGMSRFTTPRAGVTYVEAGATAIAEALRDASLDYEDVQQVYAGFVYGDSTAGQRVVYQAGMTGVPIINVNNNCSSGSTALYLARQAVASGAADCVLAVGFEQMRPGAIGTIFDDRPTPYDRFVSVTHAAQGYDPHGNMAAQFFGGGGAEHMRAYGTKPETFAKIAVKARQHAARNERAVFRQPVTVEEVLASPRVFGPLTRLQCCPPTSGAAAALVVSEQFAKRRGLSQPVRILGQALTTDRSLTFESGSMISLAGADMTRAAAVKVYEQSGFGPADIGVVELHDCFTTNELITYEALGLAGAGEGERLVENGDNTYGGRFVINPSGGLLSKGHPLGATGLAQCAELIWQLRGQAGARQVEQPRFALQHNLGLGGACVVTLYATS